MKMLMLSSRFCNCHIDTIEIKDLCFICQRPKNPKTKTSDTIIKKEEK